MHIPGYTIIEKLNSGGMASVYLATQLSVGRVVALKIMKPELDQDPEFHQRFQREAVIIGQLSHPNIIPIFDVGRYNGFNYISMEYLPNGSLEEKVIAGITANDAITIITTIASALEHAHTKGYVHRDIKPENILFRADNSAVLTDFGIAKTIQSDSSMTQVGSVIGTPYYMSPEQAKGEPSDGRSDLYSVGVLFYEMLTGARPFNSDSSLSLALQHVTERPPRLPIQFLAFQEIIDKLLAKKPQQRFQTARELITALEDVKVSLSPLITHKEKTGSFTLFKAIFSIVGNDVQIIGRKLATQLSNLSTKRNENVELFDPATSPDSVNARTTVSTIPIAAISAATDMDQKAQQKRLGMYGALAVLILIVVVGFSVSVSKRTATQSSETFSNGINSNSTDKLSFVVNTQPENALVRILNIKEKYEAGIELPPGSYEIEVSAPGYQTKTEWFKVSKANSLLDIALTKLSETDAGIMSLNIPEMREIAATRFLKGDPSATGESAATEAVVASTFSIGKYEVTFNEYDYFAIATNRSLPDDKGWGRGNRPVINVSWEDAQAYVDWLSQTTGERYRLPTDNEWELAARGNTTTVYWWGNEKSDATHRANCRFGCRSFFAGMFGSKPQPVGTFPANNNGLFDTAGNVAEWVEDCYQADGTKAISSGEVAECENRIVRGGSFRDGVKDIASHSKNYLAADDYNDSVGFRILKEITPENRIESKRERRPRKNAFQRFLQKFK